MSQNTPHHGSPRLVGTFSRFAQSERALRATGVCSVHAKQPLRNKRFAKKQFRIRRASWLPAPRSGASHRVHSCMFASHERHGCGRVCSPTSHAIAGVGNALVVVTKPVPHIATAAAMREGVEGRKSPRAFVHVRVSRAAWLWSCVITDLACRRRRWQRARHGHKTCRPLSFEHLIE